MLFNATLTEAQATAVPLDPTADRSSNAYFARCLLATRKSSLRRAKR